jgi:hypothetical protein
MKKRFRIIESSNKDYMDNVFEIRTVVSESVELDFTTDVYRVFYFTGLNVKLVKDLEYMIGELH